VFLIISWDCNESLFHAPQRKRFFLVLIGAGRCAVLQDAPVAGWRQSLNERAPAPESQDTVQIAATLNRGPARHSLLVNVGTQAKRFPGLAGP